MEPRSATRGQHCGSTWGCIKTRGPRLRKHALGLGKRQRSRDTPVEGEAKEKNRCLPTERFPYPCGLCTTSSGKDKELYGDLSDVPTQRLKEAPFNGLNKRALWAEPKVKGVIKSIRDLWRSGRCGLTSQTRLCASDSACPGVGSVSHLREWWLARVRFRS